jgi:hypothetical protein
MTDTRDQFHERESQVAPPVRSGEIAHTPLSWRVGDREPYVEIWGPMRMNNYPILASMESEPRKANAELIVRAVNSHADMLAALKETAAHCYDCDGTGTFYPHGRDEVPGSSGLDCPHCAVARAAIAKATMTAQAPEQSPLPRETGAAS